MNFFFIKNTSFEKNKTKWEKIKNVIWEEGNSNNFLFFEKQNSKKISAKEMKIQKYNKKKTAIKWIEIERLCLTVCLKPIDRNSTWPIPSVCKSQLAVRGRINNNVL